MKVLIGNRELIYGIVNAAFKSTNITPTIGEFGVLDGSNALKLYDIFSPQSMYLIDSWSSDMTQEYVKNNAHRPWVDDIEKYASYFGGSLFDQSTFDRLFDKVTTKFRDLANVRILRCNTNTAIPQLVDITGSSLKFDYLYVDASHQYETVLDDLLGCETLLSGDGFLQLNDCCHSAEGLKQNLGVLEAAVKFCKLKDFVPVLVTNTDFSDVLLVRKTSNSKGLIDQLVINNDITYVELPHQLLGAMTVAYGKRTNLSFS